MSVDSARFFDQLEKMKKFKNDLFDYTCFIIGLCLNKLKFVSLSVCQKYMVGLGHWHWREGQHSLQRMRTVLHPLNSMILKKNMKKFKNDLFDNTCFIIGLWVNKLKFVRKMSWPWWESQHVSNICEQCLILWSVRKNEKVQKWFVIELCLNKLKFVRKMRLG